MRINTKLEIAINNFYKNDFISTVKKYKNKYVSAEDVEDIIQNAFLKIAKTDTSNINDLKAYIKKSIHNSYYDYVFRQNKKQIPKELLVSLSEKFKDNLTYEDIIQDPEGIKDTDL